MSKVTIKLTVAAFNRIADHNTSGFDQSACTERGVYKKEYAHWFNAELKGKYYHVTADLDLLFSDIDSTIDVYTENMEDGEISKSTYNHICRVLSDLKRKNDN